MAFSAICCLSGYQPGVWYLGLHRALVVPPFGLSGLWFCWQPVSSASNHSLQRCYPLLDMFIVIWLFTCLPCLLVNASISFLVLCHLPFCFCTRLLPPLAVLASYCYTPLHVCYWLQLFALAPPEIRPLVWFLYPCCLCRFVSLSGQLCWQADRRLSARSLTWRWTMTRRTVWRSLTCPLSM